MSLLLTCHSDRVCHSDMLRCGVLGVVQSLVLRAWVEVAAERMAGDVKNRAMDLIVEVEGIAKEQLFFLLHLSYHYEGSWHEVRVANRAQ